MVITTRKIVRGRNSAQSRTTDDVVTGGGGSRSLPHGSEFVQRIRSYVHCNILHIPGPSCGLVFLFPPSFDLLSRFSSPRCCPSTNVSLPSPLQPYHKDLYIWCSIFLKPVCSYVNTLMRCLFASILILSFPTVSK